MVLLNRILLFQAYLLVFINRVSYSYCIDTSIVVLVLDDFHMLHTIFVLHISDCHWCIIVLYCVIYRQHLYLEQTRVLYVSLIEDMNTWI